MSLCQRADGRWVVKIKDALRPGKWKQFYFKTKEEALEFQDEQQQDAPENNRLTVYEAVMLYIKNKKLSKKVEDMYIWLVSGVEKPNKLTRQPVGYAECIADKYVDSLTRRDLEMVRDCARAGGAGNVSINMYTGKLEAAFNYCASEDLIPENPWAKYKALPAEHGQHSGTAEDFQRIYAVLPAWMQWACRTASALCVRPGETELFGLRWAAVDWTHGTVTVWQGKVRRQKVVYPPAWWLAEASGRFRADGSNPDTLMIRTARGKSGANGYLRVMRRARKLAGVRSFPLYALRHLTASQLLAEGADPAAVAAQLGHSTPATTLRYYAHALPSAQRAAAAKLMPFSAPETPALAEGSGRGAKMGQSGADSEEEKQ